MTGVKLRQLGGPDAEAFSALRRLVTADDPVPMGLTLEEELNRPLQGFRDQLSAPMPNAAFGILLGRKTAGLRRYRLDKQIPLIRERGLGRQVVGRALDHARQNSVRRVNLTVFLPNPAAVNLYASLGFQSYGLEPEAVCLGGNYHDGQHMTLAFSD
jgi:GNAT superfamily N-acetyltransferase